MLVDKTELEGKSIDEVVGLYEQAYSTKEQELTALANKNADGIFNGAAEKISSFTGIAKGEKEKFSDYFVRVGNEYLPEASKSKIEKAVQERDEWKQKFENHKGDETLKQELEKYRGEVDKIPTLLEQKENEWKEKYQELETSFNSDKLNRALSDSMPKFDDNANKFEVAAKKDNAVKRIQENYELSFDEKGNLIATKDYQKYLVADLLKEDQELKDLLLIEQEQGGGGDSKKKTSNLSIPENISKGAAQQLIREYLVNVEKMDKLSDTYAKRFSELCKENNVL